MMASHSKEEAYLKYSKELQEIMEKEEQEQASKSF